MDDQLVLSQNVKTRFTRSQYNTFGLMWGLPKSGGTCPGATTGCQGCLFKKVGKRQTCYVAKICQIYPHVERILVKNTRLLIGKSQKQLVPILARTVENFIDRSSKKVRPPELCFRLAWSGDFFNIPYAKAWADVISRFPEVKFWAYTRSFFAIPILEKCENGSWFFSADPANWKLAWKNYQRYKSAPNIGISWMGNDPPKTTSWHICPAITKKLPKDKNRGACSICKYCIHLEKHTVKNVHFPLH